MKGIDRFNDIVEDYKTAYKAYNNKDVTKVEYKNGFVYLTTTVTGGFDTTNKYRIGQFEEMTDTLRSRSNGG